VEGIQKNRSLLLFCVIILFVGLIAFYYLGYQSSNKDVSTQKSDIASMNQQINILIKKTAERKANLANFPQDDVQAALPLWDNTEQLTLDLYKTSQSTNVELNNLSYTISDINQLQVLFGSGKPVLPGVKEVKITLVLNGTYNHIYDWIKAVQKLPRLISINGFNLEKPLADRVTENKISANLTISAYFDPSYKDLVKEILVPFKN
jgi:Tfp pilus assembly protein PilO